MEELIDDMESDIENIDVAILPPSEDGNVTEEEDISDETLNQVIPQDVCGEIVVSHQEREDMNEVIEKTNRRETPKWKQNNTYDNQLPQTVPQKLCETNPELITLIPLELFMKFIPFDYMQELALQTKLYAMQKGCEYEITGEQIAVFWTFTIQWLSFSTK